MRTKILYTLAGIAFGLLFPLLAIIGKSFEDQLSLVQELKNHRSNLLFWIINTAPIVLGFFSFFIGRQTSAVQSLYRRLNESTDNKLKALLTQDVIGVIFVGMNGVVIDVNQIYAQSTGKKKSDIIGKKLVEVFKTDKQAEAQNDLKDLLSGKVAFITRESEIEINGDKRWYTVKATVMRDETGHPLFMIGIRQEITETKKAYLKLVESSKMSSLGEMAGGIAHEINNPLAIIIAQASLLKEKVGTDSMEKEKVIYYLDKIEKTAFRIEKIVKGLKSFSRNTVNDPMEEVKLSTLIDGTLELCLDKLKRHQVDLRLNLKSADTILIQCHESRISQVIINLISNAIDAIEPLPTKWIEVGFVVKDHLVQISITDSGNGISAAAVEKIMTPFFTTKPVGKGTGLGLSISKGIIEEHGGILDYDATSTHTRFVITLPMTQAQTLDRAS